MKKIVASVVALSFAVAVAAPMAAEARSKKKRVRPHPVARSQVGPTSDYQEAIADKLPFGSSQWWQQMDREGRGGQSRAN
jgi:hypothetical protein